MIEQSLRGSVIRIDRFKYLNLIYRKGYPVFLVGLDRRPCIVVGGGAEAERKIEDLLACEALVTVIASSVTPRIRELASTATSSRAPWSGVET